MEEEEEQGGGGAGRREGGAPNVIGDQYQILYLSVFRERGRERNIHVWLPLMRPLLGTWPAAQARVLTGNRTSDPFLCSPTLNPLNHTNHGRCFIKHS